ncbi:WSCD family member AGAP003962-like [Haliotis rubra]|uniref:WSCD family member AGAP003962-like n=1 Tax=Haliotis rubra TaxID=36100 RepID=UPI001EE4FB48|nr:WSCD family member AGAP003962-like [Haliotis rubra]
MRVLHRNSTPYSTDVLTSSQNGSEQRCPDVRLSPRILPQIALASYPGSGNTWTRHLLQQMTGIATGSVYSDEDLRLNGFPGESLSNGHVVAVKTHQLYDETLYDRAILLIRNPYETFLSLFKFVHANHTGAPNIDKYVTGWTMFVAKGIDKYIQFYTSWMKHLDVLPIFYDMMKQNLTQELHRIKTFLAKSGIKGDIHCALADPSGNHKRKDSLIPFDFFYSKRKRTTMNLMIKQIRNMFKDRFRNVTEKMETWLL